MQRQVWLIPIADERAGKTVKSLENTRVVPVPERFCGGDSLRRGAMYAPLPLYLYLRPPKDHTGDGY